MENISVTRGLTELKTISKRIQDKIGNSVFVCCTRGEEDKTSVGNPKSQFESDAKANMQSIYDLMDRHHKIKSAIVKSNAITKVTINKKEMTVAECIEYKSIIESKKALLNCFKQQLQITDKQVKDLNDKVEISVENILKNQNAAGTDKKSVSLDSYIKSFRDVSSYSVFDPISIRKMISALNDEITTFESEVDFVLSESNAKTNIEI
jgi:predicted P-loop ATPase/GTPase